MHRSDVITGGASLRQGRVIKAYNGYYYVESVTGLVACKIRGRFKKDRYSLTAGDVVDYELTGTDCGTIESIHERRNLLLRPYVANVDQVVFVLAQKDPDPHPVLIDRLLVMAEASHMDILLCLNKIDRRDGKGDIDWMFPYRNMGYPVVEISCWDNRGIEELTAQLHPNGVVVLAGPSGVGKSSLLNLLLPGQALQTGDVSTKIGRGRHTTRHSHLLTRVDGGYIVDTPGFSTIEFADIEPIHLAELFRDFRSYLGQCRYSTCIHQNEPQCAVKDAVADGKIVASRYQSYLQILQEIMNAKKGI